MSLKIVLCLISWFGMRSHRECDLSFVFARVLLFYVWEKGFEGLEPQSFGGILVWIFFSFMQVLWRDLIHLPFREKGGHETKIWISSLNFIISMNALKPGGPKKHYFFCGDCFPYRIACNIINDLSFLVQFQISRLSRVLTPDSNLQAKPSSAADEIQFTY